MSNGTAVKVLAKGEGGALAEITGAEIDKQVETAKRWPRDLKSCKADLLELSTSSDDVAEACLYSLDRKEKDGGIKYIVGPSIRFAELLVYCWGNIRWGARIVEEGKEFVTAVGFCHDLERNTATAIEVKRRITTSKGERYGTDMIGVTSAAACSIAQRNAAFDTIPDAVWRGIWERSREVAVGNEEQLRVRVDNAIRFFVKAGAQEKMIYPALGVKSKAELTLDHVAMMIGLRNAVKENLIAIDRLFHPDATEERVMLGLTAKPTIGEREALKAAGKAGGGGARNTTAGPLPEVSAGADDKSKGKTKAAKADTAADPVADAAAEVDAAAGDLEKAAAKVAADQAILEESDAALVARVNHEVDTIRGGGKSKPIIENRGALSRIAETSEDAAAKAWAEKLLNLYNLPPIEPQGPQS